jgi:hypothetical protein
VLHQTKLRAHLMKTGFSGIFKYIVFKRRIIKMR